ncbi:hypothetical protein PTTG_30045, partial [Puccinia triticina 1-1 BBBD Race 1]
MAEESKNPTAVLQEKEQEISKLQASLQEMMEEMREMRKNQEKIQAVLDTPQQRRISETPALAQRTSLRFAESTSYTDRTQILETTMGAGDKSFLMSPGPLPVAGGPLPESSQAQPHTKIMLPDERKGVILDVKKTNLHFDGTEVETFIQRLEKVASIQGAGAIDLAFQLPLIINNKKISEALEQMDGNETGNWELLKKQMIRKWGRAIPFRKYREDAIPQLIQKARDSQGIKTRIEYKKFIGELEEMTDYFTQMGYSHLNPESGNPLWRALSAELKKEVTKELAHAKELKKTRDGRNIIPELDTLKKYVDMALIIIDFDNEEVASTTKEGPKKKFAIQDPTETEELKEKIKKLTNALEYQTRAAPPHLSRPSSPRFSEPRQGFSDTRPRFAPLECYYCKERHTLSECESYNQDMQTRRIYRYQGVYYYPNRQPIVVDKESSVQQMVQRFHDKQSKVNETTAVAPESTSAVIELEEWGSWVPPQMHINEGELQNNIGFGSRKSQRIQEKTTPGTSQSLPTKPQESTSKAPPPNQEGLKAPTRRKSFPGSWMEEEENVEEEGVQHKATASDKASKTREEYPASKEESNPRLDKSICNKFYKQTYTLTLEEIVKIAPHFLRGLQECQPEPETPGKGVNNGQLNCSTSVDAEDEDDTQLNYACPVGMVDMTINSRKIRTLVYTGAEMNIIPDTLASQLGLVTPEIFMRLRGIGGHFTPIVGLAEKIPISVLPGYVHLANYFVVRGSVHTVLGQPFLADHRIRLELSNQKGEVLSFPDSEGRRVFIPICLPSTPEWHKEAPTFRQNCSFQVVDWDIFNKFANQTLGREEDNIPVVEWDQLEELGSTLGTGELTSGEEELPRVEILASKDSNSALIEEDPWRVFVATPVDWANELGAAILTDEEQSRVDTQLAEAEVLWEAEPI